MPPPETIRVKISSEAAESISLTAVVVQEMTLGDLVEQMLAVTGKDQARIRDLLLRGSMVSGYSRFRWQGFEAGGLDSLLAAFPDPDPTLPFRAERCVRVMLRHSTGSIVIAKDAGGKRRLLKRRSFWQVLMEAAQAGDLRYAGYSYRERADVYDMGVSATLRATLRESSGLLAYPTLEAQVRQASIATAEFLALR